MADDGAATDDPLADLISGARAARRRPAAADIASDEQNETGLPRDAHRDGLDTGVDRSRERRRWSAALAVTLGAVAVSGFVADAVAAAQLVADRGPIALAVVWPLGGLGLIVVAVLQWRFVDRFARVPVIVALCAVYAAAFVAVLVMFSLMSPGVPAAVAWLLADQMNFLLPLLVWALAGDVFTAGQGLTVFPAISRWLYGGQVAGMAIAAVAPTIFDAPGISLTWLLAVPPVLLLVVAVTLSVSLRSATTSAGHRRDESTGDSIRATVRFVRELPAFRWLLVSSLLVLAAGTMLEFGFLDAVHRRFDGAGDIQTLYAGVSLIGFVACWAVQTVITPNLLRRRGIAPSLVVMPVFTAIAAAVAFVGSVTDTVAVVAAGLLLWRLPRWSLDASARQAALATIPDERRARTTLLIDLVPLALSTIVVAVPVVVGEWSDSGWVAPAFAAPVAVVGALTARRVATTWDDTQLSYRLKRRRRLG